MTASAEDLVISDLTINLYFSFATSSSDEPMISIAETTTAAHKLKMLLKMLLCIFFLSFELVSYAPYSLERPLVGNALKLFSQTLDVNVDST